MKIPEYESYTYIKGVVFNKKGLPVHIIHEGSDKESYKMKTTTGRWKSISKRAIKTLCGDILRIPSNGDYFVDEMANIYSFSPRHPDGIKLSSYVAYNGYITVTIIYNGKKQTMNVHRLVAETFIMNDYTLMGLCCLHTDDDKLNPILSNLSVDTYSVNNKNAYLSGLNPGNGFKH